MLWTRVHNRYFGMRDWGFFKGKIRQQRINRERPRHDQNAGNDHITIPEVYKSLARACPAIRLKHYAQLVNNFLAPACTCNNFKSRVITISVSI